MKLVLKNKKFLQILGEFMIMMINIWVLKILMDLFNELFVTFFVQKKIK